MNLPPAESASATVRVLHLEDNALDGDLVCEYLKAESPNCTLERVWTREDFTRALTDREYDLILADHQLPSFDGETALEIACELAPHTPFIFVSGTLGEDVAVDAMRRGATDDVVKPRLDRLPAVVQRALDEAAERSRRRAAEALLRETDSKFTTLVHAMPQLCWMAAPDGYITWYNQRWHEYTGTTPEQMEGWGWTDVHDPEKLPGVMQRWQESIDTGQPFEMTFPLRGADGLFRPFLTRAEPVRDEAGRVVRWLGTNTDVSAQHAAEEALRRLNETLEQRVAQATAERAEMLAKLHEAQKLETIGQLTGGVAHDFNNLLTPIVGSLDLIRRRMDSDDRSQRLISGALQAADRAKTLVQRLLAFGRRQVLEARPVDVSFLVQGMADLITRSIGPQIRLEIDAPKGLHAGRSQPTRTRSAQPCCQRARCDAGGRHAEHRRHPGAYPGAQHTQARRVCAHRRDRHRDRHGRGDAAPRGGAILLHQGHGQGNRPRPVDGSRPGRPIRRRAADDQRAGQRHPRPDVAALRLRRGQPGHGERDRAARLRPPDLDPAGRRRAFGPHRDRGDAERAWPHGARDRVGHRGAAAAPRRNPATGPGHHRLSDAGH
jgi:PAS domain S-box-containing protein